jgi:hypothetical protein
VNSLLQHFWTKVQKRVFMSNFEKTKNSILLKIKSVI